MQNLMYVIFDTWCFPLALNLHYSSLSGDADVALAEVKNFVVCMGVYAKAQVVSFAREICGHGSVSKGWWFE